MAWLSAISTAPSIRVNAVRRHLKAEGLGRGSSMFDRLDKCRIVVASAGLVHARRNDPLLQGVIRRRAKQRAGAFARHPRAGVAPIENGRHSVMKAPNPTIRLADDDRRVRKVVAATISGGRSPALNGRSVANPFQILSWPAVVVIFVHVGEVFQTLISVVQKVENLSHRPKIRGCNMAPSTSLPVISIIRRSCPIAAVESKGRGGMRLLPYS
jgi:hypothetical protein